MYKMIKANELRIGNWVELKNSGNVKVEADNIGDIVNNLAIFNPIPITPEILKKAGFKKEDDQPLEPVATLYYLNVPLNEGNLNRNIISVTSKHYKGDNETVANLTINGLWASRNVLYVHHLQNLYFYVTGKELKIEL